MCQCVCVFVYSIDKPAKELMRKKDELCFRPPSMLKNFSQWDYDSYNALTDL